MIARRVPLHGFALAVVFLVSVAAGLMLYRMTAPSTQLAVQVPSAAFLCMALYVLWTFAVRRVASPDMLPVSWGERLLICLASLVWFPVVFVPTHYVFRGYLTSFSNILNGWALLAPLAILSVYLADRVTPDKREE